MTNFKTLLLGGAALGLAAIAAPAASAQDFNALVVFGDSLADPGNIPGLTGGANFPPPPYVGNRFSNGPVIPEYLDDLLGVPTTANLAVGGSFSGPLGGVGNSNAGTLPPLAATDLVSQARRFVASGGRFVEGDLVHLYGAGPNDYFAALPSLAGLNSSQVLGAVAGAVGNVQANILTATNLLADAGATKFVLGTLPSFATIPQFGGTPFAQGADAFSSAHNAALVGTAQALSRRGEVTVVDYGSLFAAVQANPLPYGFENATDACIDDAACITGDQATQNRFFFFDGVHPTTAGHALAAAAAADAIEAPYQTGALIEAQGVAARAFGRDLLGQARATFGAPEFRSADLPGADLPVEAGMAHYGAIEVSVGYDRLDFDRASAVAASGFDLDANRFNLSAAYKANGVTLGVAAAYEDADVSAGRTEADLRSVRGGVFAGVVYGASPFVNVYASAAAQVGYTDYDAARDVRIAGLSAAGETQGWTLGLDGEAHIAFRAFDTIEIGPIARLGFVDADMDGFTETGAPAGVNRLVRDVTDAYAYGEIGLGLTHSSVTGFGLVDIGLAALYHDAFDDDGATITSSAATLTGFASDIATGGGKGGLIRLEADVTVITGRGLSITLEADGAFGDDLDGYGAGLSLGYTF